MRASRLRRRLSYANVMATLAFFFALTGGAAAATKYLTPTDPITQGDLAGSTYGNPVIASGKVTTAKIADGAVTSGKLAASVRPTSFVTSLPQASNDLYSHTLATLDNGVTIRAGCDSTVSAVELGLVDASGSDLQLSGTINDGDSGQTSPLDRNVGSLNGGQIGGSSFRTGGHSYVDLDVLARDSSGGNFERIDLHAEYDGPQCTFWGMIIPSG